MRPVIAAPSVLSLDYGNFMGQMEAVNKSGAQWIHFDVMDGHFVDNFSFGPDLLKLYASQTDLLLDVHLMVDNPEHYADVFADAGAGCLTFHIETIGDEWRVKALAEHLRERNILAGLALRPHRSVEELYPYAEDFDMFLVMSVEPGFGGQPFLEETPERIRMLRKYLDDRNIDALIEVDGGINRQTAALCRQAGADVLVAGSYIFNNDIHEAVQSLLQL